MQVIIDSPENNPFLKDHKFVEEKKDVAVIDGREYTRIVYHKVDEWTHSTGFIASMARKVRACVDSFTGAETYSVLILNSKKNSSKTFNFEQKKVVDFEVAPKVEEGDLSKLSDKDLSDYCKTKYIDEDWGGKIDVLKLFPQENVAISMSCDKLLSLMIKGNGNPDQDFNEYTGTSMRKDLKGYTFKVSGPYPSDNISSDKKTALSESNLSAKKNIYLHDSFYNYYLVTRLPQKTEDII